jgi:protein-S-isoprenylcysteine O-methyltransferase Ste14
MNKPASDHPEVAVFPPIIPLCALAAACALQWLVPLGWLAAVETIYRIPVGVFVVTAGILVTVSGKRALIDHATNVNPSLPATTLVTAGIFGWTRNPLYVGMSSAMLGISLVLAMDWLALLMIPSCLVMHFAVVMREEKYLEKKFGDEFRSYRSRVPRYILAI